MSDRYAGLSPKEADRLLVRTIGAIIAEELVSARNMPQEEWDWRDLSRWSDEIASCIYYAMENRRRGAP